MGNAGNAGNAGKQEKTLSSNHSRLHRSTLTLCLAASLIRGVCDITYHLKLDT